MLLSFSIPEMVPYIRAGLLQKAGLNVGADRVKRQTIRKRGPVAERLLRQALNNQHDGDMSLWWKSRTPMRERLGSFNGFEIYPIIIERLSAGAIGVTCPAFGLLIWSPACGGDALHKFALADGFESVEAFGAFFVPNPGDRFDGVLFKW